MKDSEASGLILQYLYDRRREESVMVNDIDLGNQIIKEDIDRIVKQLYELGLVRGELLMSGYLADAEITPHGIDVVEGNTKPPIAITMHSDNRQFNIGSITGNVQVGDFNSQQVTVNLQQLIEAIGKSDKLSDGDRRGLLSSIKAFLSRPGMQFFLPSAYDLIGLIDGMT